MKIWISKRSIIWLSFMIFGISLLVKGILADNKYREAVSFSQLDINHFEYNTYVKGDISEFVKIEISNSRKFTGVSANLNGYDVYTVPVKDGAYVRIMVGDRETRQLLEEAANQGTAPISFAGKLVEPEFAVNDSWYEAIDGFDTEQIATNLMVMQINKKSIDYTIYLGVDIIIIGLLISLTGFSEEAFIIDESEKERQKRRPVKSYNVENDILSEKKKLAMLELQKRSLQKDFRTNVIFLLGSVCILLLAPVEMKLFGALPAIFAAKGCFVCWLHQPNPTAALLAGIFGVTPIYKREKECEEMIERLERSRIKEELIVMEAPEGNI